MNPPDYDAIRELVADDAAAFRGEDFPNCVGEFWFRVTAKSSDGPDVMNVVHPLVSAGYTYEKRHGAKVYFSCTPPVPIRA